MTLSRPRLTAPPLPLRPPAPMSLLQVLASYSEGVEAELRSMLARGPALFDDLARSICPSVYGCDSVKKAILLMLMGGVHKVTPEVRAKGQRHWWQCRTAVASFQESAREPFATHPALPGSSLSLTQPHVLSSSCTPTSLVPISHVFTPLTPPPHTHTLVAPPSGHQLAWRHQRGHYRGPLHSQEPDAQVRVGLPAPRSLHQRQGLHCCGTHSKCGAGEYCRG